MDGAPSVNGLTGTGGDRQVAVIEENVSTTPTMVVLVTACLSRRGLSCLGGRLQLLHHGRGAVELPNRRGPR